MRTPAPATVRWTSSSRCSCYGNSCRSSGLLPGAVPAALSKTLTVLYSDLHIYAAALLVTLYEVVLATPIACGFGILRRRGGRHRRVANLLLPIFSSLYAVPIVILYPIFTAWFGIGAQSKIVFAGIYGFFPVMLSTAAGIRTIDPQFVLAARSMGATSLQLITRSSYRHPSHRLRGLRLGGALTIIGVVVAEMLTASAGIGYLVTFNRTILDSPRVFAGILCDPRAIDRL